MTRFGIGLVALAAAAALLPVPPSIVERIYTNGLYAVVQPLLTSASNRVPFALLDVLIVAALAGWLAWLVHDARAQRWPRLIARAAGRTVVAAAAAYLVFLLVWGFNYRRERLIDRLPFDAAAVGHDAAVRLASSAVERLNALHDRAHGEAPIAARAVDPTLAVAFARAGRDLALPSVVVGRPKWTILDWYFRRAGVDGMTDPYFLETLVADDLLPFERPFIVAHEWAHLGGLANEGEASLAGWLTCMRGSPGDQYSGWIVLYGEASGALPSRERAAIAARLGDGPRADLRAIRDRVARHLSPRLSSAGWRAYDSYLKANRVEAGAASYGEVVTLVLGLHSTIGELANW